MESKGTLEKLLFFQVLVQVASLGVEELEFKPALDFILGKFSFTWNNKLMYSLNIFIMHPIVSNLDTDIKGEETVK